VWLAGLILKFSIVFILNHFCFRFGLFGLRWNKHERRIRNDSIELVEDATKWDNFCTFEDLKRRIWGAFLWRNEFCWVFSWKKLVFIEFWLISYRTETRRIHVDHYRFTPWSERALSFPFETKEIVVASKIWQSEGRMDQNARHWKGHHQNDEMIRIG
jgi:hypothetical protein